MPLLDGFSVTHRPGVAILYYKSARVELRDVGNNVTTVSSLFSQERRKGHATTLMSMVTIYADENKLTLFLEVGRYGHPIGPDNKQLISFYEQFGFVRQEGTTKLYMLRPSQELQGL